MRMTIKTGDMAIFFTNVNRQMGLAGHSHFALVNCTYAHAVDDKLLGFPVFENTIRALHDEILRVTKKPFRDHTNELVAKVIWDTVDQFKNPFTAEWSDADFKLVRIELKVHGVRDAIGHSDSFATYVLER